MYFHAGSPIEAVNTLGAGDAFGSSFVGAMQLGAPIPEAISWDIVNSAAVIAHPDAKTGLLEKATILQKVAIMEDKLTVTAW